jgi:hypothetical protein
MNMDKRLIAHLLVSEESGWLDFKREMYKVADPKAKDYEWNKNELTRDILSLANGNTHSTGKTAYLILGAEDNCNDNGLRDLFDVGDFTPSKKQIMSWVNAYADPAVEEINTHHVLYQGKRLFVVEILPGRYVHKIKRDLQTAHSKVYHMNTVFMRAGDRIITADAKQVHELERTKKQALTINRYVNPAWLLGLVLFVIFATIRWPIEDSEPGRALINEIGYTNVRILTGGILGLIMGGSGYVLGLSIMQFQELRLIWLRATVRMKIVIAALAILFTIVWLWWGWTR